MRQLASRVPDWVWFVALIGLSIIGWSQMPPGLHWLFGGYY